MKSQRQHDSIHEEPNDHSISESANDRAFNEHLELSACQKVDSAPGVCDEKMSCETERRASKAALIGFGAEKAARYALQDELRAAS